VWLSTAKCCALMGVRLPIPLVEFANLANTVAWYYMPVS